MLEKERDEYLEEIYEIVKENNKMLKAERRSRVYSRIFRLIWMIVVIAVPLWIYYKYLQPIMGDLQEQLKYLEQMSAKNPLLGKQIAPILEKIKTLSELLGASAR